MFGDKLREIRLARNVSQKQLADVLYISQQAIAKWESNRSSPNPEMINKLADYFGVSVDYLLGREEIKKSPEGDTLFSQHPEIFRPKMRKVPLLGKVACGQPIYSPSFDDGFALINDDIPADFALVAKGDSMTGVGIHDGDVVFFREQDMVDNGQIAAVFVDDEVTLKRVVYYREKNKLILYSENPAFEPLVYIGSELDEIIIIGRAIAQLRKL